MHLRLLQGEGVHLVLQGPGAEPQAVCQCGAEQTQLLQDQGASVQGPVQVRGPDK